MTRKRYGAAPAKETTPIGKWLPATKPLNIVADKDDEGRLTPFRTAAVIVVGALFLFCFMWLAAAY